MRPYRIERNQFGCLDRHSQQAGNQNPKEQAFLARYRILPTNDGNVAGAGIEEDLLDDATALAEAQKIVTPDTGAEVWEGDRLLAIVPPTAD